MIAGHSEPMSSSALVAWLGNEILAGLGVTRQFGIVGSTDGAHSRLRRQNFNQMFLQRSSLLGIVTGEGGIDTEGQQMIGGKTHIQGA